MVGTSGIHSVLCKCDLCLYWLRGIQRCDRAQSQARTSYFQCQTTRKDQQTTKLTVGDNLPEFGADLVAALAVESKNGLACVRNLLKLGTSLPGLDVHDFTHVGFLSC